VMPIALTFVVSQTLVLYGLEAVKIIGFPYWCHRLIDRPADLTDKPNRLTPLARMYKHKVKSSTYVRRSVYRKVLLNACRRLKQGLSCDVILAVG
jgi:hypothetical protein